MEEKKIIEIRVKEKYYNGGFIDIHDIMVDNCMDCVGFYRQPLTNCVVNLDNIFEKELLSRRLSPCVIDINIIHSVMEKLGEIFYYKDSQLNLFSKDFIHYQYIWVDKTTRNLKYRLTGRSTQKLRIFLLGHSSFSNYFESLSEITQKEKEQNTMNWAVKCLKILLAPTKKEKNFERGLKNAIEFLFLLPKTKRSFSFLKTIMENLAREMTSFSKKEKKIIFSLLLSELEKRSFCEGIKNLNLNLSQNLNFDFDSLDFNEEKNVKKIKNSSNGVEIFTVVFK